MTEVAPPPVLPAPDDLTRFFWDGARDHVLRIQRCTACGTYQHPPEPVCHHCLSFDLGHAQVSGQGTVYSHETATQAFHPYFADRLPFCIAVVELAEQPNLRLVTNIVDTPPDKVTVGARVEVTFNDLSDGFVLPVFRLVAS
jgi:hypothetical protein